jgi:hypothetical protein
MPPYSFKDWRLIGFEEGSGNKKYKAILEHKTDKKKRRSVSFGDKRYEQYKDSALGLYSYMDHLDKKRRDNYRTRHKGDNLSAFTPGWFSWHYLW